MRDACHTQVTDGGNVMFRQHRLPTMRWLSTQPGDVVMKSKLCLMVLGTSKRSAING